MKNFDPKAWFMPQAVIIIGTYDADGTPNAMNWRSCERKAKLAWALPSRDGRRRSQRSMGWAVGQWQDHDLDGKPSDNRQPQYKSRLHHCFRNDRDNGRSWLCRCGEQMHVSFWKKN